MLPAVRSESFDTIFGWVLDSSEKGSRQRGATLRCEQPLERMMLPSLVWFNNLMLFRLLAQLSMSFNGSGKATSWNLLGKDMQSSVLAELFIEFGCLWFWETKVFVYQGWLELAKPGFRKPILELLTWGVEKSLSVCNLIPLELSSTEPTQGWQSRCQTNSFAVVVQRNDQCNTRT